MSDFDDDLDKFGKETADDIRPIDTGGPAADGQVPTDFMPKEIERILPPAKTVTMEDGAEVPAAVALQVLDGEKDMIHKGDYIDLRHKVPSLKQIYVAAGWEQKAVEDARIDVDLSCFLIDKNGQTRVDSDFVFYNNVSACDGAVKHLGDNRTGAGAGDNETIFFDLNSVPFDVYKVMFVLSIYDEGRDGLHFGQVRGVFMRIINADDDEQIGRLVLKDEGNDYKNVVLGICMVREGPKWFAEVLADPMTGGLAAIAKGYGILIQEDTG